MIGLVAGLAFTVWRKSIRGEIEKIRELLDSEHALDEEHREYAMKIIKQGRTLLAAHLPANEKAPTFLL